MSSIGTNIAHSYMPKMMRKPASYNFFQNLEHKVGETTSKLLADRLTLATDNAHSLEWTWGNEIRQAVRTCLQQKGAHNDHVQALADKVANTAVNENGSMSNIKAEMQNTVKEWVEEAPFDPDGLKRDIGRRLKALPTHAPDEAMATEITDKTLELINENERDIPKKLNEYLKAQGIADEHQLQAICDRVKLDLHSEERLKRKAAAQSVLDDMHGPGLIDSAMRNRWDDVVEAFDLKNSAKKAEENKDPKGFFNFKGAYSYSGLRPRVGGEALKMEVKAGNKTVKAKFPARGAQKAKTYAETQLPIAEELVKLVKRSENNPNVSNNFFKQGSVVTQNGIDRHKSVLDYFEHDVKPTNGGPSNKEIIDDLKNAGMKVKLIGRRKPTGQDKLRITSNYQGKIPFRKTSQETIKVDNYSDGNPQALARGLDYAAALGPVHRPYISPQFKLTQGTASELGSKRWSAICDAYNAPDTQEVFTDLKQNEGMKFKVKAVKDPWYTLNRDWNTLHREVTGAKLRIKQDGKKTRYVNLDMSGIERPNLAESMDSAAQYARRLADKDLHRNVSHRVMLDPTSGRVNPQGLEAYDSLVDSFSQPNVQERIGLLRGSRITVRAATPNTVKVKTSNFKPASQVHNGTPGYNWDDFTEKAITKAESKYPGNRKPRSPFTFSLGKSPFSKSQSSTTLREELTALDANPFKDEEKGVIGKGSPDQHQPLKHSLGSRTLRKDNTEKPRGSRSASVDSKKSERVRYE